MRTTLPAAMAALTLIACSDAGTDPTPGPVPVHTVAVSPGEITLAVGAAVDLAVTLYDANDNVLTGRTVSYTSQNPQVVTVTPAGRLTGVGVGLTKVTVTSEGKSAEVDAEIAEVAPAVASVELSQGAAVLLVGQQLQLTAVARDATGQPLAGLPVQWWSDQPGTATVNTLGQVEAFASGVARITATIAGRSATAVVTVTTPPGTPPLVTSWRVVGVDRGGLDVALQSDLLESTPQVRKTRYSYLENGSFTWNETAGTWHQQLVVRSFVLVEYGTFTMVSDLTEVTHDDEGTSRALSPAGWFEFTSTKVTGREFIGSPHAGGLETFQQFTPTLRTVYLQYAKQ